MTWEELESGPPQDAVVIGGGINGANIASELASAGLRVALFEKDDFGFGTTWRTTKLIHGGLRYLEYFELRLVFESLRERRRLLQARPHLVRPLRFALPILPWTRRPRWQLRAGLSAYDLLARGRILPRHRSVSAEAMRKAIPGLTAEQDGGFTFYDALAIAPERLALEMALEAEQAGAFIANHIEVSSIDVRRGRVRGVTVCHDGRSREIPAKAVVNAAGPWVDAVNRTTGENPRPLLGVTKGTHVALQLDSAMPSDAIFSTAKSDGRVFFAVPRDGLLLVGTTDNRFDAEPGSVRPEASEIAYLVSEARELLPGCDIDENSVRYAYAGLRPLQRSRRGPEASITRKHAVIDHAERGGPGGLYSVVGGKLSTSRPLAKVVASKLGVVAKPVAGHVQPAGSSPGGEAGRLAKYGIAVKEITKHGEDRLCKHSGLLDGELVHALRNERAETLSDVLLRRTGAGWASCRALCNLETMAAIAADKAGWDDARTAAEIAAYRQDVATNLPAPAEIDSV
jgi:glycerol-3-phosphate dehydrogenase